MDRIALLEQKLDIVMTEFNSVIGSMTQAISNIADTNRLFTAYVQENLVELKERLEKLEGGASVVETREGGVEL